MGIIGHWFGGTLNFALLSQSTCHLLFRTAICILCFVFCPGVIAAVSGETGWNMRPVSYPEPVPLYVVFKYKIRNGVLGELYKSRNNRCSVNNRIS